MSHKKLILTLVSAAILIVPSCVNLEPENPDLDTTIDIGFHVETDDKENCLRSRVPRTKKNVCLDEDKALETKDLIGAEVKTSTKDEQAITILFSTDGSKKLEEVTGANKGKRLGFVIEGKLITAPTIAAAITGPTVTVSLKKTPYKAFDLVKKINTAIYETSDHTVFHPYKELHFKPSTVQQVDTSENKKIADWLRSYPKDATILIQGFFCSEDATANYQKKLLIAIGEQRAQTVKVALVENGLMPVRINAISQGKSPDPAKCIARVMVVKVKDAL